MNPSPDTTNATVETFLSALRSGGDVPPDLESRVMKFPEIDQVRRELRDADVAKLLVVAGTDPQNSGRVAFALLIPFVAKAEVRDFLLAQWPGAGTFLRRNNIMWPLLEIHGVPDRLVDECVAFVFGNLDMFVANCRSWWESQQALEVIRTRMNRPVTPPAKQWLYLCVAMGSPDRDGVLRLLSEAKQSTVGKTAEVAGALLQLLQQEPGMKSRELPAAWV